MTRRGERAEGRDAGPTQLETAAAWAASFRLEEAPPDVIDLSRRQIANILAAVLAGSRSEAGRKAWRAARAALVPGPCTIVPYGARAPLWDALYLHAVFANALELDDFHYRGHLGQAAVLTPLAVAEAVGADGADILRAQIAANELAGRLGWAITAEVRHGHLRAYLQSFAAAAAAGLLLRLDAGRLAEAFALALTLPPLPLHPGMYSPESKVLAGAAAVVEGARAAFQAREGLTGARDILEHRSGLYRQMTLQRRVANPFVQLGEAWCTQALCFKRYAACGYAAGAVQAACAIGARPDFRPEEVERIDVATSLPGITMERLAAPHRGAGWTPVNVQFSTLRSAAAALAFGDLRGTHFAAEAFPRLAAAVDALGPKAHLRHDWRFTVNQLQGIDDGLNAGGSRNSADMLQFYRTTRLFRSLFGSARAIGLGDPIRIARLPRAERAYFFKRWGRSLVSRFRRRPAEPTEERPLGDLRRLSWRMGSRVTVRMRDGRRLTAECLIPSGMAGDPDRGRVVEEKLLAEGEPVLGRPACLGLWREILSLPAASAGTILGWATGPKGDPRDA